MTQLGHESFSSSETSDDFLFRVDVEVEKHYSRKNNRSIGYRWLGRKKIPFIRTSEKHLATEREFLLQLLQNGVLGVHTELPISGMAVSGVLFIESPTFVTKKGNRINLRGGDLDNIVTSYLDALIKAKILSDDALITTLSAIKRPGPKNKVRLWLFKDDSFKDSL